MKRSLFYVGIAAVQGAASLTVPLFSARVLGATEVGVLAFGLVVIIAVRSLASLGLYGAITIRFHNSPNGEAIALRLLWWSGTLNIGPAIVLVAAGAIVGGNASAYLLACAAGFAAAVSLCQASFHRSNEDRPAYATAMLAPTALAHTAGLLGSILISPDAPTYLMAFSVSSVAAAIGQHFRHCRVLRGSAMPELRAGVRLGAPLVLTAVATAVLAVGDRPMIEHFLGTRNLGQYFVVYIMGASGIPLLGGISSAWLPAVLKHPAIDRAQVLASSLSGVIRSIGLFAAGSALIAPTVVRVVSGDEFVFSGIEWVALFAALAVVPYAAYTGASIGLMSGERTIGIFQATAAGAAANLALNLLLIPSTGLMGAALATVGGYGVTAAVALRLLSIPLSRLAVSRISLEVGAGASAVAALSASLDVAGAQAWIRIAVGSLAAGVGMLGAMKAVSRAEAEVVRNPGLRCRLGENAADEPT